MRSTEQGLEQIKGQLSEAVERYRKLISSQAEQTIFDRYLSAQNEYLRESARALAAHKPAPRIDACSPTPGVGLARVDSARGLLIHQMRLAARPAGEPAWSFR